MAKKSTKESGMIAMVWLKNSRKIRPLNEIFRLFRHPQVVRQHKNIAISDYEPKLLENFCSQDSKFFKTLALVCGSQVIVFYFMDRQTKSWLGYTMS
jgi:hypothetical protein